MAEESEPKTWEEWIKTRPAAVQEVAKEFPAGCHFHSETIYAFGSTTILGETPIYIVGYGEVETETGAEVGLMVSLYNPKTEYEKASKHMILVQVKDARIHGLCKKNQKDERKPH